MLNICVENLELKILSELKKVWQWVEGWMNGWVGGWMDGWVDGW